MLMISIERITVDDLAALAQISEELSGRATDVGKMTVSFSRINSNPDYFLIGAKDEQHRLIGMAMAIICQDIVGECRPFMVLENIIVTQKQRGSGIGRKLIQYTERIACERGCYYIMLVSLATRTEAHKFYEALGYNIGVVQGFKKYL
jgi:GNAT superfamily N-acetyltransferase